MGNYTVKKIHKNMYPATHNFKDDTVGGNPTGWTLDEIGGTINIIASFDGHRKVVELARVDGQISMYHTLSSAQADETIECWVAVNDIGLKEAYIYLYEGATCIISLRFYDADMDEYDGGAWNSIKDDWMVINTLYHIKIILNDTANTYDAYINGVLEGNNIAYRANSTTGMDKINFIVNTDNLTYYVADIGFSSDTDYKIGDNIHWRHYKDQDSDFESEDCGTTSTSIGFVDTDDSGVDCNVSIVPLFNEHKKVLKLYDLHVENIADIYSNFSSGQASGTIELWIMKPAAGGLISMGVQMVNESAGTSIFIYADLGNDAKWIEYDGANNEFAVGTYADDMWFHLEFEFECGAGLYKGLAADTYNLYINGIKQLDGEAFWNVATTLDKIRLVTSVGNSGFFYADSASYSWTTGNKIADNRTFEYNDTYTREDITTEIVNAIYSNKIYEVRKCSIFTTELFEKDLYIFQIYDINTVLSFEGEIRRRDQNGVLYRYLLRDKNWDDLNDRITHTFTTDDIHDPADSAALLLTALPTVGQEDGDLLLVEGDIKTTVYSPVLKSYPRYRFLRDIADIADSTIIITAEGKVYMDDDKASGTVLDLDVAADKDSMTDDPLVADILETINYFEIFGAIDPDTGDRFYKIIDNSGTDKKRKWRHINNEFRTQTDLDNYAAKLEARIVAIKIITIYVQGLGIHNMGTTMDYKFVTSVINIPQANYYIIEERINFDISEHIIVLSEGMIEESKYALGFEKPQNYLDSFAGEIYETDINTIDLNIIATSGVQTISGLQITDGEYFKVSFYIDEYVDASRDMEITISYHIAAGAGGTFDFLEYFWFSKTDGSEDYNANEESNTPTFTATTLSKVFKYQYIMAASKFDAGDSILATWIMNEAGPEIRVRNITLRYYIKRPMA